MKQESKENNQKGFEKKNLKEKEFGVIEERVIEIKRVSKKTTGGNKIGFTALVAVGDNNGKVGVALGKASDVSSAISKATSKARKEMLEIKLVNKTISHRINLKMGASKILLKPAPQGSGLIAGGSVRKVLEVAGIRDISVKILGSRNRTKNVYSVIKALKKLK